MHIFYYFHLCLCVGDYVCVCINVCRYLQRPGEGIQSLEPELYLAVSHPMWVLGI